MATTVSRQRRAPRQHNRAKIAIGFDVGNTVAAFRQQFQESIGEERFPRAVQWCLNGVAREAIGNIDDAIVIVRILNLTRDDTW